MGIHEDAFQGVLSSVAGYTSSEINSIGTIDANGESTKVTPLAAACYGGQVHVVKLLLNHGALPNQDIDKRTPFFFTFSSNAIAKTQSTIVDELINKRADVNLVCDEDGNSPLMAAILSSYERIIRRLVKNGAAIDGVTNSKGATPRSLAKERHVDKILEKDTDTDGMSKQEIVNLIVGLVQTVIAYANKLTKASGLLGGIVKHVFDFGGIEIPEITKHASFGKPGTIDQFTSSVANYALQKNLSKFFPKDDGTFFTEMAKKAVALSNDPSTDLGKPENIGRLTVLSLYEPVLYLDDSGSMNTTDPNQSMTRFKVLGELVKRIASIATKIVPDSLAGVELRFINSGYAERHDEQGIIDAINKISPRGGTAIGTKLRERVLRPIVYDQIARKSDTNPIPLKRPVLVCIITDGAPNGEDTRALQNEILQCRNNLRAADFEDDAVMFCISQIGQATEATEFLDELQRDVRIDHTVHVSTDRLDDMFTHMKGNERDLEVWLLKLLTKPIFERDAE